MISEEKTEYLMSAPCSDATTEGEISALVDVYSFILEGQANRNTASVPSTDDDAMRGSEHDPA